MTTWPTARAGRPLPLDDLASDTWTSHLRPRTGQQTAGSPMAGQRISS
jgi:hypothetical protein